MTSSIYATLMIVDGPDQELMRLWGVVGELSEELSQTRHLAVQLYTQANDAKVRVFGYRRERFRV